MYRSKYLDKIKTKQEVETSRRGFLKGLVAAPIAGQVMTKSFVAAGEEVRPAPAPDYDYVSCATMGSVSCATTASMFTAGPMSGYAYWDEK